MHFQHLPREAGFTVLAMIMAGLVLVLSCLNVANLLLSRARTRETAIRLSLGARRTRLIRQLLTESALLGVAGVIAGLWFAWGAGILMNHIRVPSDLPFFVDIHSDYHVLLFSLAAGVCSVFLFGLAPALQGTKMNLSYALKSTGEKAPTLRQKLWGRQALVAGQIAISSILLVVAAMVYNGFRTQFVSGAGFRTGHILMMTFDPRLVRYSSGQVDQFYKELVERTQSVPGVKSVSLSATVPLAINQRSYTIDVVRENAEPAKNGKQEADHILHNVVDERFFDTMAIPVIHGRGFNGSDTRDSPAVVIVNDILANRYWPGADPVGKRIQIDTWDRGLRWAQVVGVAATSKYVLLTEAPTDYLYMPITQITSATRTLLVQSNGDAAALTTPVRELVHNLDSNMLMYDVRTMEDYFQNWVMASADTVTFIVGMMGLCGLILAMIGLYGLMAYSVTRRTREFGIRMAIGATKQRVVGMVLGQAAVLCAFGLVAGVFFSYPATRVLAAAVFTARNDWSPYVVVPLVLFIVTLAAAYSPARRAAAIDPMKALREE